MKIFVNNVNNNILIYDITGKIVKQINTTETMIKIDIHDLHSGIYFIEINNTKQKFIKE